LGGLRRAKLDGVDAHSEERTHAEENVMRYLGKEKRIVGA
jgi:hypothetical protein